jgi:CRISPR-associated endonuclease Cas1
MQAQRTTMPARAQMTNDSRVLIIDSYNFSLTVRSGHIVIKSGEGEKRIARIDASKSTGGIARIIILSHVGSVSMEAMRWASKMDVPIFQVSRDGEIGFCSPAFHTSDARIYKQQVLAQPGMPHEQIGLDITRELLTTKLVGQIEILREFGQDTTRACELIQMMALARDVRSMLAIEGNIANLYWKAWQDNVYVPWDLGALRYIPGHWSRFHGRSGLIKQSGGYKYSSNRDATDFVNACLNYAYKIAETEAMYACYIMGLHPALGMSHGAVHEAKSAMALDIIEAVRPVTDRVVLSYMDHGNGIPMGDDGKPAYLEKECGYELDNGTCRLYPPMTARLATAVSMAVAPHVIEIAQRIVRALTATEKVTLLAPLDPRIRERKPGRLLSSEITIEEIVPDHIWRIVDPMLPPKPGKSTITTDPRAILAAIIAHELYGVTWPKTVQNSPIDYRTARSRLGYWQKLGVWESIKAEFTKPGISLIARAAS